MKTNTDIQAGERTHFLNYPTMEEAISRANSVNQLAASGNQVMNCDLYEYSAGPAFQTSSMTRNDANKMGGLYRQRVASRFTSVFEDRKTNK